MINLTEKGAYSLHHAWGYTASMHVVVLACTLACHEQYQFLEQKIMGLNVFLLESAEKQLLCEFITSTYINTEICSAKHVYYNW